jgi:hypothetical protein
MPRMTAAHSALATLAQPVVEDPRLAAISKEEAVLDPRHDDIIRGGHGLLTAAAFLLRARRRRAARTRCRTARKRLGRRLRAVSAPAFQGEGQLVLASPRLSDRRTSDPPLHVADPP